MKFTKIVAVVMFSSLITGCGPSSPEEVTKNLIEAMSNNECEKARDFVIEDAAGLLQMVIDGGCVSYKMELKSVTCQTEENSSTCTCIQELNGLEMAFNYDLKKVNDEWKISSWPLDF